MRSAVAGPQSSATVLALLPILAVGLGAGMGADPLGLLFGTATGRLLLCTGAVLDAAGVLWTLRLVERALR